MWARLTLRKDDALRVEPIARALLKISGMLAVYLGDGRKTHDRISVLGGIWDGF